MVISGLLMAAEARPAAKDVVIATVGASAALTGLVLVFLGMILPASNDAVTFKATRDPDDALHGLARGALKGISRAESLAILAFFIGMIDIGLGLAWLAIPGGHRLYVANVWVFVIELVAIGLIVVVGWGPLANIGFLSVLDRRDKSGSKTKAGGSA